MPSIIPAPSLLIASILGRSTEAAHRAISSFCGQLGQLIFLSEPLSFEWTGFYSDDLGPSPTRFIVAVEHETDTSGLSELKRTTCRLEITLARPGQGREVNIDPGLLSADQLVLASTKPRAHRLYLGHGIYGDLMLLYGPAGFSPLPWTYPDYASAPLLPIFGRLRHLLLEKKKLRQQI
jgi:hypothetical protein